MSAPRTLGRYVLYDVIASGGMASVHIGRLVGPVGFSRLVAIKRLHTHYATDPEFVTMFLDEARLAARIRHPNVVSVIDVVAESGELFLVMEYVIGESLSRLLRASASQPLPLPIGLAIMADVLYGLGAAHDAQSETGEPLAIVHRDVSPQNVIVGRDGVARVLDFGIAKAASRAQTTQDGQLKGKFAYMAPEQLRRQPLDRRTDIFAASIVLWEVLTCVRLFAADDHGAVVERVLHEPIKPPSSLNPALDKSVDAIVMKGLSRNPADRFQTAQEMAAALEQLGTFARPVEIGNLVEKLAGRTLADRARLVSETESGSGSDKTTVPADEKTASLQDERDAHTDLGSTTPARARPRGWLLGGVIAFALTVVGVWSFVGRHGPRPPPSVEAPPPVVTASQPPAAITSASVVMTSEPSASAAPPPHVATHRRTVVPSAPKPDCNPPFVIDANGLKHFKPECINGR